MSDEVYELLEEYSESKKDVFYNKDKWESGEINLCFITGLSGSGKTTLAYKLGGEVYELDDILQNHAYSDNNLKEYGDMIYSFFRGPGKKYRTTEQVYDESFEKSSIAAFINYAKSYASSHRNKKFILEGVELYWFYQPQDFRNYAVCIKGTSTLKSMHRSAWRDSGLFGYFGTPRRCSPRRRCA